MNALRKLHANKLYFAPTKMYEQRVARQMLCPFGVFHTNSPFGVAAKEYLPLKVVLKTDLWF
jgi:hypothetical protein